MITIEDLKPGTEAIVNGKQTTILTGSYQDPQLGWMVKSTVYPGGYPLEEYELTASLETVEEDPAITFEVSIVEKEAPVKVTADLIREKAKPLMALTIKGVFDNEGYEAVKKAKNKAVKMRTSIKSKEDEVLKAIKSRHAEEIKQVTDYTGELYKVCLEAQNDLQGKLDKIDVERKELAEKEAAEHKAKTEGRNNAMFSYGMMFNGFAFSGYGKSIAQDVLHVMDDDKYAQLLTEIEGLQVEHQVTGKQAEASIAVPDGKGEAQAPAMGVTAPSSPVGYSIASKPKRSFPTAVYQREIPGTDMRVIITKGQLDDLSGLVISNDRILESGYYINVMKYSTL